MQAISFKACVGGASSQLGVGTAKARAPAAASAIVCKSRSTYQVQVVVGDDEPQDNAMKRFRREVMSAGVIPEVRRRRYFENSVDAKKRKHKEARMAMKRQQAVRSFSQVSGQEPTPFSDMFSAAESELEIYF